MMLTPVSATLDFRMSRPNNTAPVGTNPIRRCRVEFLGEQKSVNSEPSKRDLGFTGHLGGSWYAVYGDTLWEEPFYMIRNGISRLTANPLEVEDLNVRSDLPRQNQFIPWNAAWGEKQNWFIGVSSLLEVDKDTATGAIFYLVTNGIMSADCKSIGSGIAMVRLVDGVPTVAKRFGDRGYWWNAENNARWGDISAFRDPRSDYIYAWGGAPESLKHDDHRKSLVFLTRVKPPECFNLSSYEYWWGHEQGWSSRNLDRFDHETAVWDATGQGQVVWNDYLGCYVLVHLTNWGVGHGTVHLRTADRPEGPWTPDVRVFRDESIDGGFVYAGVAHPYLDPSGRTLTVSWTNNNIIRVARVDFTRGDDVKSLDKKGQNDECVAS
ncbi:hypothetical protein GE09DRAFT_1055686 [Coniochaeta sp. 2T2.1]|nr:hypothetical protein GE09DRAFT_1055686 [Coniochaeta sp. 2T2.1]